MCEPHVKHKALLVGISDDGSGQPLPAGPKNDVLRMKNLLLSMFLSPHRLGIILNGHKGKYKLQQADIVSMYDKQKQKRPHLVPTRENIVFASLVTCWPTPVFPFVDSKLLIDSGHASQQENLDGSELDGFDECLETKTGRILDDELKAELIDQLCPGSQLVAIFDACHSATLTDLPHVGCHGFNANEVADKDIHVPLPTDIFGQRTNLPRARFASFSSTKKPYLTLDTSFPRPIATSGSLTSIPPDTTERFPSPIDIRINGAVDGDMTFYGQHCSTCHDPQKDNVGKSGPDLPRVLVISACEDSQVSYEDERGRGMTMALCDYLNDNANPSLNRLFNALSFKLFNPAFDRVNSPEWNENAGDFPNAYQQLSFSSLQRLNPNCKFSL
ncbi:hypothetical protein BDN71DRAFT_1506661 [Pleurotus eryngii]|uniref:Cytochrome c domain-containing protein n=1 Tax=Pleurotus eryngii TaxID=5323 RepID=A0A9P5ZYM7_PLEER|nr:hypothetical protein BDN71DRAFT_1506661 [Pleurotus eryngii]